MDKEKFIEWLKEKNHSIISNATTEEISNKETRAFLRGSIVVMDEIKTQVESGKFDLIN